MAELKDAEVASVEDAVALGKHEGNGRSNRKLDAQFNALLEMASGLGLDKSELERTLFEAKVRALVKLMISKDSWHSVLGSERKPTKPKGTPLTENNIAFFETRKATHWRKLHRRTLMFRRRVEELVALRKLFNSLLK